MASLQFDSGRSNPFRDIDAGRQSPLDPSSLRNSALLDRREWPSLQISLPEFEQVAWHFTYCRDKQSQYLHPSMGACQLAFLHLRTFLLIHLKRLKCEILLFMWRVPQKLLTGLCFLALLARLAGLNMDRSNRVGLQVPAQLVSLQCRNRTHAVKHFLSIREK